MTSLLKWALIFLIIAGVAALFGFTDIAHGSEQIAKVLFFSFLTICIVLFVIGMTIYKSVT